MDSSVEIYADAGKEGSPLYGAITREMRRLEKENPSFFYDTEWPLSLAAKEAAKLRIAPKAAAEPKSDKLAEKKPVVAKPVAKRPAIAAPAPGGISGATGPNQFDQIRKEMVAARAANDGKKLSQLIQRANALAAA